METETSKLKPSNPQITLLLCSSFCFFLNILSAIIIYKKVINVTDICSTATKFLRNFLLNFTKILNSGNIREKKKNLEFM